MDHVHEAAEFEPAEPRAAQPRATEPEAALGLGIAELHRTLTKSLTVRFSEEGTTVDHWCVLSAIAGLSSPTMSDLARKTRLPNATLTRIVDSLVSDALVFRLAGKDDRRRINVYLSDFGRQRLNRLSDMASSAEHALAGQIGESLVDDLRRTVDRVLTDLNC